ncbi:LacI family DNA-binding transcriptional regulator [Planctomycetota bacterium]|nr:LacI family DNA-binding transcriptional regulator [Planctomycetota bacterium]
MSDISITRVAKEANVSVATVSRVINDHPVVKKATAEKVRTAIEKLGYKPGKHSTNRSSQSMGTVPLKYHTSVLLWTGGHTGAHTLTGHQLQEGAATAMRRYGINMLVDYLTPDWTLPSILENGRVDGILLHGPPLPEKHAKALNSFPTVWLFYQGSTGWGDRVQPDHRLVGHSACNYMLENNCRNVCVVSYAPTIDINTFYTERADAFEQSARLRNIPCQQLGYDLSQAETQRDAYNHAQKIVKDFLALSPRPEGIFVANELVADIHEQLIRHGVTPMKDVMLIGGDCDHIINQRHLEPQPVMYDINASPIGQLAVQLLLTRIACPDLPRMTQLVQPDMLIP